MHLEAMIVQTCRPWSSEFGDALEGHDQSRLEVYFEAVDLKAVDLEAVDLEAVDLEAVDLEAVDLEAVDLEAADWEGGATGAETLFIG